MLKIESELKKRRLILPLLTALEDELRNKGLWQEIKPDQQALDSREPFAIDSLSFVQWLQFIFLDKMAKLVRLPQPLPSGMQVLPMAQEYFKSLPVNSAEITDIIGRIDLLFSE
ncbi:hypothetical protein DUF446 [Psychromonas ingrahamii 37]|uniref:YqcC-like domain-containing protein n=1 Tax=Psychromonas ingrahamii (strain DSM 17664 / CCUG 51855 / 37) TaxID=357804 RepID=A1ST62_PSYIN|nr:YqcC family protein [Psychromonas ingrahamii]ABM02677.1 hypothetical protein DUF446 [Psychromonas ingrahamii 37]